MPLMPIENVYARYLQSAQEQASTQALIEERRAMVQERRQKMQEAARQQQDEQNLRQTFAQYTTPDGMTDYGQVIGALNRTNPEAAAKVAKFVTDQRKAANDANEAFWKQREAQGKVAGNIGSSIHSEDDLQMWRQTAPEFAQFLPEHYDEPGKAKIQAIVTAGMDATQRGQEATRLFNEHQKAEENELDLGERAGKLARYLNLIGPEEAQTYLANAAQRGIVSPDVIRAVKNATPQQLADMQLTEDQKRTLANQEQNQTLAQTREAREAANQAAQLDISRGNLAVAQGHLAVAQRAEARQEADKTAASQPIEQGTPQFKVAQDLAYGRMTFPQFRTLAAYNRDSNMKMGIYAKAAELNPQFNPADFERGYKFVSSPRIASQLASLDNVQSGVNDLLAASDAAKRSGSPFFNKWAVEPISANLLGGKKYSNFKTAVTAFADELSGALGYGSATDMSREMGFNMTDINTSPDVFRSNIENIVMPFVERKRASLLKQGSIYGTPQSNSAVSGPATAPKSNYVYDPKTGTLKKQ